MNDVRGFNSRLDPLQAAVLEAKLAHLDTWNRRRSQIADSYSARVAGTAITPPGVPAWADPAWHLYVVRTDRRDAVQAALTAAGIGTLIHYPIPPHLQRAYADLGLAEGDFPIAEQLAGEVLSIPIGPQMTDDQVAYVGDALVAAAA